ncbi:MAG: glycosyl hydrolase family 28-related protein [Candidatus Zipacnadales bacterium]
MKLSLGKREMRKTILRCWKICLTILLLGWLIGGTAPGHANGGKSMVSSSWFERTRHGPTFRNVKDFGARGDGVSDDTDAIQRAIDFERGVQYEKKPAFVYLPAGRYVVSDTLILWKWTHLVGEAKPSPDDCSCPAGPRFRRPNE